MYDDAEEEADLVARVIGREEVERYREEIEVRTAGRSQGAAGEEWAAAAVAVAKGQRGLHRGAVTQEVETSFGWIELVRKACEGTRQYGAAARRSHWHLGQLPRQTNSTSSAKSYAFVGFQVPLWGFSSDLLPGLRMQADMMPGRPRGDGANEEEEEADEEAGVEGADAGEGEEEDEEEEGEFEEDEDFEDPDERPQEYPNPFGDLFIDDREYRAVAGKRVEERRRSQGRPQPQGRGQGRRGQGQQREAAAAETGDE